jgi:formate dehydrogenase assembly factor FdhD
MRGVMRIAESPGQVATALVIQPAARTRAAVPNSPRLSQTCGQMLRKIAITDAAGERRTMHVPVERPLRVLIDGRNVATLWTLGACAEWLVLGYLWNQQIAPCRVSRSTLLTMLERMSRDDTVYRVAGSAHGCALFCEAELWLGVEDVSRRNAVDSISGWMALHGVTGGNLILYSTGRLTVEIVMKAAYNGISTVVSGKGMTASCCDLADRLGMTLFGHAAKGHFTCYAGAERFDAQM